MAAPMVFLHWAGRATKSMKRRRKEKERKREAEAEETERRKKFESLMGVCDNCGCSSPKRYLKPVPVGRRGGKEELWCYQCPSLEMYWF